MPSILWGWAQHSTELLYCSLRVPTPFLLGSLDLSENSSRWWTFCGALFGNLVLVLVLVLIWLIIWWHRIRHSHPDVMAQEFQAAQRCFIFSFRFNFTYKSQKSTNSLNSQPSTLNTTCSEIDSPWGVKGAGAGERWKVEVLSTGCQVPLVTCIFTFRLFAKASSDRTLPFYNFTCVCLQNSPTCGARPKIELKLFQFS